MANLDVQPKKKSFGWIWILLLLVIIGALYYYFKGRPAETDNVTTATTVPAAADTEAGMASSNWDSIDRNSPSASYEEISDTNIFTRSNSSYSIYSLGENVLFDQGKSTINKSAEPGLKQVASSIEKRFANGEVRIYGYTDAAGTDIANKMLAQERAESVKNWLTANTKIGENNISLHPMGEAKPVATNATPDGRQQNRRVEIVARKK